MSRPSSFASSTARAASGLTNVFWIVKDYEAGSRRQKLAKYRQALRQGFGGETSHAREIASWMSEARDEAGGDRIAGNHNDWNSARCVLSCHDRLVTDSHDDIHFLIDEFAGEAREFPRLSSSKAVFHLDIFALGPSELLHTVLEMSWRNCGAETQIPDLWKPVCLRRTRARASEDQDSRNKWSRQANNQI